jgi:hypothetical protein
LYIPLSSAEDKGEATMKALSKAYLYFRMKLTPPSEQEEIEKKAPSQISKACSNTGFFA